MHQTFIRRDRNVLQYALRPLLLFSICLLAPASSFAESAGCQLIPDDRNPSEKILRCGDDLTIRSAPNTNYRITDRRGQELPRDALGNDRPNGARLEAGALMIEFKRTPTRRNFQILTPHAIAAVRGTTWAVEVEPDRTSTLAISGLVEVRRPNATRGVTLRAGQGADVGPGTAPITVKRWGKPRVQALLARFGR